MYNEVVTISVRLAQGFDFSEFLGDDDDDGVASSQNGAQNARKTGAKGDPPAKATSNPKKPKPTKTSAATPSGCTPSPSKPLPPSASKFLICLSLPYVFVS